MDGGFGSQVLEDEGGRHRRRNCFWRRQVFLLVEQTENCGELSGNGKQRRHGGLPGNEIRANQSFHHCFSPGLTFSSQVRDRLHPLRNGFLAWYCPVPRATIS